MGIIKIINEAAPSSSETLEEYVERLSHLAPNTQLIVNDDLNLESKSSVSSVIIKLSMILSEVERNDEKDILYRRFINHHLGFYEDACWDCPEPFKA
jgi:hypothetical protein